MWSLILVAAAAWGVPGPADGSLWIDPPRMHDPTLTSVTVAAVPAFDCELALEIDGRLDGALARVRGGALYEHVVAGLSPDARVDATLHARQLPDGVWTSSAPLSLVTLHAAHSPVRFALLADTHAWAVYSKFVHNLGAELPYQTMLVDRDDVIDDAALDFAVAYTDTAMTECGTGCQGIPTELGPTTGGDTSSFADALVRYRMVWGKTLLGRLAATHPVFVMNGDHEGEAGYQDDDVNAWSRAAREMTLPKLPTGVLRGPPGTLAFAIETGPVLLVALDVHSNTVETPLAPSDWHLGAAQMAWFVDTLGSSTRPWKIVLAEHLVGGLGEPGAALWKGRGGITATDTNDPSGTFLGEQAQVHEAMRALGGNLFVSAHDHVAAWGVKDGVAYLLAGRAGGVGHPWADEAWYAQAMDYDGDGVPEYDSGTTGTREPGHVVVEADDAHLRVIYVHASLDAAANGETLLEFTLDADAR